MEVVVNFLTYSHASACNSSNYTKLKLPVHIFCDTKLVYFSTIKNAQFVNNTLLLLLMLKLVLLFIYPDQFIVSQFWVAFITAFKEVGYLYMLCAKQMASPAFELEAHKLHVTSSTPLLKNPGENTTSGRNRWPTDLVGAWGHDRLTWWVRGGMTDWPGGCVGAWPTDLVGVWGHQEWHPVDRAHHKAPRGKRGREVGGVLWGDRASPSPSYQFVSGSQTYRPVSCRQHWRGEMDQLSISVHLEYLIIDQ